ncbi:MAG: hypothetical protein NTX64_08085 [Elusimicrobia bacterium]|nr:hypothetical protein [Elusimicrobiota bacterium]
MTLLPGVAAGAGVRWLRMSLAGTARATAGLADLGALWRGSGALQGLSAGAAWQNLGRDIKFESVGDPPPTTVRGGLAYTTGVFPARKIDPGDDVDLDATIAADAVKVAREGLSPRLGLELGLHPDFLQRAALRFGWVFNRPGENLTAGLGLRTGRFFVDYAVGAGDLGAVHQISVATSF